MANPLRVFRKYQYALLVGFGVMLMFAFVVAPPLSDFLATRADTGAGRNPVVVTWKGGELREADLGTLRARHLLTVGFLNSLVRRVEATEAAPIVWKGQEVALIKGKSYPWVGRGVNEKNEAVVTIMVEGEPVEVAESAVRMIFPRAELVQQARNEEDLVNRLILSEKAHELGVVISDAAIEDYLDSLCDVSDANRPDYAALMLATSNGRLDIKQFQAQMKIELAAQRMSLMAQGGLYAAPPEMIFDCYDRLNRRVTAELLAVNTADFVDQVEEPSEDAISALYEKGKDRFPDPLLAEPGFKQRQQIAFGYFQGVFEEFLQREVDVIRPTITDQQIEKYYEDNKATEFRMPQLPADEPEPKSDAAAAEQPATEPATPPADGTTPPTTEPAAPPTTEPAAPPTTEPAAPPSGEPAVPPTSGDTPPAQEPAGGPPQEPSPPGLSTAAPDGQVLHFVSARPQEQDSPAPEPADPPAQDEPAPAPAPGEQVPPPAPQEPAPTEPAPEPAPTEPAPDAPAPEPAKTEEPAPTQPALDAPASGEGTEPAAKPAEPPVQYKPLDEKLREEIRTNLARRDARLPAQEKMEKAADTVRSAVENYARKLRLSTANLSAKDAPLAPLDYAALAKDNHLTHHTTPLVDELDIAQIQQADPADNDPPYYEFARATETRFDQQMGMNRRTLAQVAYSDDLPLFVPRRLVDGYVAQGDFEIPPDKLFIYWREKVVPKTVPPLSEVRQDVVQAWKLQQALPLARAKAEQLAKQAAEAGKPLADVFPDNAARVITTNPFSWMTRGALPGSMQAQPRLSTVTGQTPDGQTVTIFAAGADFMEGVFALEVGQLGVAIDQPQKFAYVVRVTSSEPPEEQRREAFFTSGVTPEVGTIVRIEQGDIARDWYDRVEKEYEIDWQRPPETDWRFE